jgi:FG-GAP repeat protein/List-Bact-rpt repeat protein
VLRGVGAAVPRAASNRVFYRRGALGEWYANGPLGLEQGFEIAHRPVGVGALTFSLALSARAHLEHGAVLLPGGLRYAGAQASDADGRALRAWLELRRGRVLLRVDDRRARYPVRVDPFIQQAQLTAGDGAANDHFGQSVAVSGSTVLVGTPGHTVGTNTSQGAVYVFTVPPGGWTNTTQTAELTASDGAASDGFGSSVAVAGNTIVAGAPSHKVGANAGQGAAYVFTMPAGGWVNATQTAELTASDGAASDGFGSSVAVAGSTIVAGARNHKVGANAGQGAAYVFTMPTAGPWVDATQIAELTASDGASGEQFGSAVAISGGTIVAGAFNHKVGANNGQGAAYVFTMPTAGPWVNATQTAELTAGDGASGDHLGSGVAASGATVVAGAPNHRVGLNDNQGAAYVFVMPSMGGWVNATQQAELTASDGGVDDSGGRSVAVSGTMIVASAFYHTGGGVQGAAYEFEMPAGGWATMPQMTQTAVLTAADASSLLAVSVDGSVIVAGAPFHRVGTNAAQGATYLFQTPSAGQAVLSVAKAGPGAGSVASSPSGIDCGRICSHIYNDGTAVTLTATPAAGWAFAGWSGGGCSGTGACTVTSIADTTVTATFVAQRTLTVSKPGSGAGSVASSPAGIDCGSNCSHAFGDGAQVTLTATAAAGSTFEGWSGGGCSGTGTCTVTLTADTTVTATFTALRTLTVLKTGSGSGSVAGSPGGIDCGGNCSHVYRDGTQVTLTAVPASGSTFDGWSGGGCSGTGLCTVTMGEDTVVSATFTAQGPPPSGCDVDAAFSFIEARGCFHVDHGSQPGNDLWTSAPGTFVTMNGLAINPAPGAWIVIDQRHRKIVSAGTGGVTVTAGNVPVHQGDLSLEVPNETGRSVVSLTGELSPPAGAAVAGLKLTGNIAVQINDTRGTLLDGRVTLPFGIGSFGSVAVHLETTLKDGLKTDSIRAEEKNLILGPLEVKNVFLQYSPIEDIWAGGLDVVLPTPNKYDVSAMLAFQHGRFKSASGQIDNLNFQLIDGVYLQRIALSIAVDPLQIGGGLGVSAGPQIEGKAAVRVDGNFYYRFPAPPQPGKLHLDGTLQLAGFQVASAYFNYLTTGSVDFGGELHLGLPDPNAQPPSDQPVYIEAYLQGWIDGPNAFDVEVGASLKIKDLFTVSADLLASNIGMAACGQIAFLRGGFGYTWATSHLDLMGPWSCDVGPWRSFRNAAPATAGEKKLALSAGGALLKLTGSSAPPKVTLRGPGGQAVSVPLDPAKPIVNDHFVVFQIPSMKTTYIAIHRSAGRWTMTPEPKSSAISDLKVAGLLAPPQVKARVTGQGRRRTLTWTLRPLPGQKVLFAEVGPQTHRKLALVSASHGTLRFTPGDGKVGARRIIAVVESHGRPRTQLTVARYSAPPPLRPGRPGHVRARRLPNGSLRLSWTGSSNADGYVIRVKLADGATIVQFAERRSRNMVITDVVPINAATVSVAGRRTSGVLGPAGVARLTLHHRRAAE